jgi:hypothetical protein
MRDRHGLRGAVADFNRNKGLFAIFPRRNQPPWSAISCAKHGMLVGGQRRALFDIHFIREEERRAAILKLNQKHASTQIVY